MIFGDTWYDNDSSSFITDYFNSGISLIFRCAGRPGDRSGRTSFTFIPKPEIWMYKQKYLTSKFNSEHTWVILTQVARRSSRTEHLCAWIETWLAAAACPAKVPATGLLRYTFPRRSFERRLRKTGLLFVWLQLRISNGGIKWPPRFVCRLSHDTNQILHTLYNLGAIWKDIQFDRVYTYWHHWYWYSVVGCRPHDLCHKRVNRFLQIDNDEKISRCDITMAAKRGRIMRLYFICKTT